MYLVPVNEPTSMSDNPTSWLVNSIIDELESLAVECREAAADHQGEATEPSVDSVRSLNQAAETCEHIVQMIRQEYSVEVPRSAYRREALRSRRA